MHIFVCCCVRSEKKITNQWRRENDWIKLKPNSSVARLEKSSSCQIDIFYSLFQELNVLDQIERSASSFHWNSEQEIKPGSCPDSPHACWNLCFKFWSVSSASVSKLIEKLVSDRRYPLRNSLFPSDSHRGINVIHVTVCVSVCECHELSGVCTWFRALRVCSLCSLRVLMLHYYPDY